MGWREREARREGLLERGRAKAGEGTRGACTTVAGGCIGNTGFLALHPSNKKAQQNCKQKKLCSRVI